jgi:hypothetical protein
MGTLGNLSAENEGKGAAMTGYMAKHDDVCLCDDCCARVYRQGVQNATRAPAETPRAPRDPDGTLWERARDLSYSLMLSGGLYGAPATIEANVARAIFDALAEGRAYSPATVAAERIHYDRGKLAYEIVDAVLRSPLFADEHGAVARAWRMVADPVKGERYIGMVQAVAACLSKSADAPTVDVTAAAPARAEIDDAGSEEATRADGVLASALLALAGSSLFPMAERNECYDALQAVRRRLLAHAEARRGK